MHQKGIEEWRINEQNASERDDRTSGRMILLWLSSSFENKRHS